MAAIFRFRRIRSPPDGHERNERQPWARHAEINARQYYSMHTEVAASAAI